MTVPTIQFTLAEMIGLYFLKGAENVGQGTTLTTTTQDAFRKIELLAEVVEPVDLRDEVRRILKE